MDDTDDDVVDLFLSQQSSEHKDTIFYIFTEQRVKWNVEKVK